MWNVQMLNGKHYRTYATILTCKAVNSPNYWAILGTSEFFTFVPV